MLNTKSPFYTMEIAYDRAEKYNRLYITGLRKYRKFSLIQRLLVPRLRRLKEKIDNYQYMAGIYLKTGNYLWSKVKDLPVSKINN